MDLTGVWIGRTVGVTTQMHHWIIVQRGNYLTIYTRWSDETTFERFEAYFNEPEFQFYLSTRNEDVAQLTSGSSFIIPQWVYTLKEGVYVPEYDAVFERRDSGILGLLLSILLQIFAGNESFMRWIG